MSADTLSGAVLRQYAKEILPNLELRPNGELLASAFFVSSYIGNLRSDKNLVPRYGISFGVALSDDVTSYENKCRVFSRESDSRNLLQFELRRFIKDASETGTLVTHGDVDTNRFRLTAKAFHPIYMQCRDIAQIVAKREDSFEELMSATYNSVLENTMSVLYGLLIYFADKRIMINTLGIGSTKLRSRIKNDLDSLVLQQ